MRSELFGKFENPEVALEVTLAEFLRTPGRHRLLETFQRTAESEVLPMLYDQWATSKQYPQVKVLEVFIHRWNVDIGTDSNTSPEIESLYGTDLFAYDLEELCIAINTLMQTNELTAEQIDITAKAEGYYRNLGGANPGAISIARGWHELMLVIRGAKRLARCQAPECGRLLMYDSEGMVLSGTPEGYHSMECLQGHTAGGPSAVPSGMLPGAQDVAAVVGQEITHEQAATTAQAAATEVGEQQPEGSGNGVADIPGSSGSE